MPTFTLMDILTALQNNKNLPSYPWQTFAERLQQRAIPKKALLLKKGQPEQWLYFLEKGIVRFFIEQGDKEITFDFAFPGSFFCAFTSFLTHTPVAYHMQALTACSVHQIHRDELETMYSNSPSALAVGKWAAEQQFLRKSARELSLLTQTAEQRYLALLQNQPDLVRYIPLQYLASYIGITPQALSRIRRRIVFS